MATRFAQIFARTGAPNLVRQFGEEITYYADGTGTGRTIWAIVERNVASPSETGGQAAQELMIRVRNSSTFGISASEIDDGLDEVLVALDTGGTPERRQITRTIDDANGMVRFMVR